MLYITLTVCKLHDIFIILFNDNLIILPLPSPSSLAKLSTKEDKRRVRRILVGKNEFISQVHSYCLKDTH